MKDSRRAAPTSARATGPRGQPPPTSPGTHVPGGEGRGGRTQVGDGGSSMGMVCHGSGRGTPVYQGALAAGSPYALPGRLKVRETGCLRSPNAHAAGEQTEGGGEGREARRGGEGQRRWARRPRGATGRRQVTEDALSWACRVRAPHPGTRVYIPDGGLHSGTGARELELAGRRRGNDGEGGWEDRGRL